MVVDLSMILNPWVIFWIACIVILIVIIVLFIIERKLNKKLKKEKEIKDQFFQKESFMLTHYHGKPEEQVLLLDRMARKFFYEAYGISRDRSYAARGSYFKKNTKGASLKAITFCEKIQEILYSGNAVEAWKVKELITLLEILINEYKFSKEKETAMEIKSKMPHFDLKAEVHKVDLALDASSFHQKKTAAQRIETPEQFSRAQETNSSLRRGFFSKFLDMSKNKSKIVQIIMDKKEHLVEHTDNLVNNLESVNVNSPQTGKQLSEQAARITPRSSRDIIPKKTDKSEVIENSGNSSVASIDDLERIRGKIRERSRDGKEKKS